MQRHVSKHFTPRPPLPRTWGKKVKIQLFQNIVMLHIKLKGIKTAATWQQIFCSQTTTDHGGGVKNSTLSEHGHVAYQTKRNQNCSNMAANILPADLHVTLGVRSNFNYFRTCPCCIPNYQIKGNHKCSSMVANSSPLDPPPPLIPRP